MSQPVQLFVTCVGDLLAPDAVVATVRLLRATGHEVAVPDGQTCCGQPAWNAGFVAEAAEVAATTLDAFWASVAAGAPVAGEPVVVPAGSCATMIRLHWADLFERAGDPVRAERARTVARRTVEVTELLAGADPPDLPELALPTARTVACHKACHLLRELHVDEQAQLLSRVRGCEVVDWDGDDRCCGFGGTFSVKLPEVSVAMADEKLDSLPTGVEEIVSTDASCLLHLRTRAEQRGLRVRTRHVAEVLAEGLDP